MSVTSKTYKEAHQPQTDALILERNHLMTILSKRT